MQRVEILFSGYSIRSLAMTVALFCCLFTSQGTFQGKLGHCDRMMNTLCHIATALALRTCGSLV